MWGWMLLTAVVIILILLLGFRNANHNYTIGSGMFKQSDENLRKDEHMDPSDFQYYNTNGKVK